MKKEYALAFVIPTLGLVSCTNPTDDLDDSTVTVDQTLLSGAMPYRGVNLAGADFALDSWGNGPMPPVFDRDYIYPDPAYVSGYNSADYFIGKGMTTFRLPFRWENLQPTRRQAFDANELGRLRTTVNRLTGKGAQVLLDPHNYARYYTAVVGSGIPNADFADFWSRLATEFKGNSNVIFGLVNEPHDMPTEQWLGAANAAISAIRSAGASNLILVPGNGYTGALGWTQNDWYGTSNATVMLNISDPGNNYAFEVHQYLDSDSSGGSSTCVSPTIGAERMQGFTNWLRSHGKKGFLGEFGGGSNQTCLAAIDDLLRHLESNTDVYLGWNYWAAGPWWGDYFTSLEPTGGTDKPQMDTLEPHLGALAAPTPSCSDGIKNGNETGVDCGGSCAPCPTSSCSDGIKNGSETGVDCGGSCAPCPSGCQPTTYEAESMFHSTGGATTGGWNIWSNGYISTNHTFAASGSVNLTVTAAGEYAGGAWPHMVVSVGGTTVGSANITSTGWAQYTFTFTVTSGTKEVRISFDNDYYVNGADRNLLVDNVAVGCPE